MKRLPRLVIEGGVPLKGEARVSGSKNSSLPCLFAALLTDEECVLHNVPDLVDIHTTCLLLEKLGKKIERKGGSVIVRKGKAALPVAPYDLVTRMRASALVLGPLLARYGKASAALPGGCAIGNRPIDIHLSGLEKLGSHVDFSEGMVRLKSTRLKGASFRLKFPSVGATENLLMAAVLASGKTVIKNAAREPEIVDLANFLNEMGGRVAGAGGKTITVHGRPRLYGAEHTVIPDRIEAATYLIAAAATKGKIELTGANAEHLGSVIRALVYSGVKIEIKKEPEGDRILCAWRKPLRPVSVSTKVFPGFPTDVQAQWMALMTLVKGKCRIEEDIFENRYLHAAELRRMGARIEISGRRAVVTGVPKLSGATVMVSDLRAGAAMIIAGLAAHGRTVVRRIYHLDRGYEHLEKKLSKLGAKIRRVK